MSVRSLKPLLVAVFSLSMLFFYNGSMAQPGGEGKEPGGGGEPKEAKKEFNAGELIFGHVLDAHEFHFFSYEGSNGEEHEVVIPLPVILYSPQKGFSAFMSSEFHHAPNHEVKGYKLENGKIIPVEAGVKVYDISLTRNVVQMLIALTIFVWIMLAIAKRYKKGEGVISAPKGKQNLFEVLIIFIRDEVGKPNLGHKVDRYLPFLLTVFFFILINNIFGLIPGSANVTGNIAFTAVLGVISFIVLLASSNKHYWSHIFNPPGVPVAIKPILILIEFISVFIKPFALIIRLFANMVAGHIIIICLISLIFIFGGLKSYAGWIASPFSVAFTIFIYFIEILVAFLQAYIFTMLTAVFVGQAIEEPYHHDEHHEGPMTIQ